MSGYVVIRESMLAPPVDKKPHKVANIHITDAVSTQPQLDETTVRISELVTCTTSSALLSKSQMLFRVLKVLPQFNVSYGVLVTMVC